MAGADTPPPDDRPPGKTEPGAARNQRKVGNAIGRRAERKLEARRQGDRGVWFGLGMFGLVGWAVAIPTLAGIALGIWLDERVNGQVSWTLTFLFIGAALGCLNAWYWIQRESRHD
jgi:ATP synthase protein I